MGFSVRPKKGLIIAVFNISSSSIGGALFKYYDGGMPEILSSIRIATKFFPEVDFQKIQRSLHKTFEEVIGRLKIKMPFGQKKPDLAIIVFSSPYYISQTKLIRIENSEPIEITENFLENIIDEESRTFIEKWQNKKDNKNEVEIIEREAMNFKLNGYPVENPKNKKAKIFETELYISLGIKIIYDKLKECILHSFGETPIRFQSFPFVSYGAIKNIFDLNEGLLLVDMGGEVTDLIIIRKKTLEEIISFPLGENFLIRRVSSAFGFSPEETISLIGQYSRGDIHEDVSIKLKKILEDVAKEWRLFFEKGIKNSSERFLLPPKIIFIGGRGINLLKNFIFNEKDEYIENEFLMPESFKKYFIFAKEFNEDKDILLMLSIIFANKLF